MRLGLSVRITGRTLVLAGLLVLLTTRPAYAATQYALFSSLYALPGKLVAGSSGFVVAAIGYPAFFVMTSLVGIPVLIWTLLPIYHLVLFAISPKESAFSGKLWPDHPTMRNFAVVFTSPVSSNTGGLFVVRVTFRPAVRSPSWL